MTNHLEEAVQENDFDRRIDQIYQNYDSRLLKRQNLKKISEDTSVDFAALYFAKHLLEDPVNARIQVLFEANLQAARDDVASIYARSSMRPPPYVVLLVPGWNYVENGHLTGADLETAQDIVTRLGFENHVIGIDPIGSVEKNADIVANEIIRHAQVGRPIILAGPSSAGPAIHLALGDRLDALHLHHVKGWLNLGGILQGSPLVDHWWSWPRRWLLRMALWFRGWDEEHVLSMSAEVSRPRFARLDLPDSLLVVNYLGIPLSGELSRLTRDQYPILRRDGPNDGLTLLADAIAPKSVTIVELGRDHFFAEDPEIDLKTVALAKTMIQLLEARPVQQ